MAKLTSQQVNELANYFLVMAQAVGDYRYQNFDNLSKEQNIEIKELLEFIRKCADDLFSLSSSLIMIDVQTSLAAIGEVTNQMKITYKTLQDIQKAINIAASVATLGKAILNKDLHLIRNATEGLADKWKSI